MKIQPILRQQWAVKATKVCKIQTEFGMARPAYGHHASHTTIVQATGMPWRRHQMETFSALLALCAGNSPFPVNSPHKGQWRGALMFSLIYARINDWVKKREAGDLRRHRGHYDVSVMQNCGVFALCPVMPLVYVLEQLEASFMIARHRENPEHDKDKPRSSRPRITTPREDI